MNISKQYIHGPDSFHAVPWRNGRGETLVLLLAPVPGSDTFAWRISIAAVDSDGPFSFFPDCDRTLILLDGRGITLTHSTGHVSKLSKRFAQAHFPGDNTTVADLHDGPIRDFNIMWNRNCCSTTTKVFDGNASNELVVDGDILLVYAADASAEVHPPLGEAIEIEGHHLLHYENPAAGRWRIVKGPAIAIQITMSGRDIERS